MPARVLHHKEEFKNVTNGSRPVIVDLADQESRYGHIEEVFDRLSACYGVAGYRIAPKIVQIPVSKNSRIFQVYNQGQMIRQIDVTESLIELFKFAMDVNPSSG